jgi:hypothetical protein
LAQQAEHFQAPDLLALIDRASSHYERIHRSTQPRILLEAALVEYTLFESRVLLSDLIRRLQEMSNGQAGAGSSALGGASSPGSGAHGRDPGGRGKALGGAAASLNGSGAVADRSTVPATEPVAAAAETVPGWTSFIQALLKSQPGLASCLMEGLPSVDEKCGRFMVAFAADKAFQMQRLCQERQLLEEKLSTRWGHLKLELVTAEPDSTGGLTDLCESLRQSVAPTEIEALQRVCREDHQMSELVELLQGEPVPEQEQDDWLQSARNEQGPLASENAGSSTESQSASPQDPERQR